MSQIRSRDTKPEILVRKFLHKSGYRFRLYRKDLPGKPDIVLPKYKVVLFVNGCFWHGHFNCKYYKLPGTLTEWWKTKIDNNILRDEKNISELIKSGWNVVVIWSCKLKPKTSQKTLEDLVIQLDDIKFKLLNKLDIVDTCLKTAPETYAH